LCRLVFSHLDQPSQRIIGESPLPVRVLDARESAGAVIGVAGDLSLAVGDLAKAPAAVVLVEGVAVERIGDRFDLPTRGEAEGGGVAQRRGGGPELTVVPDRKLIGLSLSSLLVQHHVAHRDRVASLVTSLRSLRSLRSLPITLTETFLDLDANAKLVRFR
jgi:hypothetical protein